MAVHREGVEASCWRTIRTDRTRISMEISFVVFFVIPLSTRELGPPASAVRFNTFGHLKCNRQDVWAFSTPSFTQFLTFVQ